MEGIAQTCLRFGSPTDKQQRAIGCEPLQSADEWLWTVHAEDSSPVSSCQCCMQPARSVQQLTVNLVIFVYSCFMVPTQCSLGT
jgi:hypothetical protein